MAASDQLARQWGILRALQVQTEGLSARQIGARFSISKNTAMRDVESLIAAGFAVRTSQVKNRHVYRMADGVRALADIQATPLELLALYAARTQLAPLAGTPISSDLMSLIHKAQGSVSDAGCKAIDALATVFLEHPRGLKNYRDHQETIDDLVDAILRRRVCDIDYRTPYGDAPRTHEIRPLKLFFNRGGLYLFCLLGSKRHLSTLAVERIVRFERTKTAFSPPRGVDLDSKLRGMFGVTDGKAFTVEVRFSARAAPFIRERIWHPDQQIETLDGGAIRWTATVKGKEEILAWVMSRGEDAELVRPKAWRPELQQRLAAASVRYD